MAASVNERVAFKEMKFDCLPKFKFRFTQELQIPTVKVNIGFKPMREGDEL